MKAHVGSVATRGTSSWNQKLRRNLHQKIKKNLKPYRRFIGLTAYQDLRFLFCTYFSLSLTPYIMGCWGTLVKKTCLTNKPFCLQNIINKIKKIFKEFSIQQDNFQYSKRCSDMTSLSKKSSVCFLISINTIAATW